MYRNNCFTIDIENTPFDSAIIQDLREKEETGEIEIYLIKNGTIRWVLCTKEKEYDEKNFNLLITVGVELNYMKDVVQKVSVDILENELSKRKSGSSELLD